MLELNNVTVTYASAGGSLTALSGMELAVAKGELAALVGPSGCGKTTVLNVLAGQVKPVSGSVRLAGEPVDGMLPSVGYISQADTLLPWRTGWCSWPPAPDGWSGPTPSTCPGPGG